MRTQRKLNEIRPLSITPHVIDHAEGSVEIKLGKTHLICTATLEPQVPKWLQNSGQGWVTAEYGMLPRSTHSRIKRERAMQSGRTQEISRLIGRSLRAATDLTALGERQIYVDCDVIQADGGTRTAAISGGFVALALAFNFLKECGTLSNIPLKTAVAAISVGLKGSEILLDLDYEEDSQIDTDMNIVMNADYNFIEVQGTAESHSFSKAQLMEMLDTAKMGCQKVFEVQNTILQPFFKVL
ncbi:MAG: ribonuclease PH [Bdellovibrio sp.]|nr:MAG: ribonuclease PH [Bdellovibrio sp.]